MAVWGPWAMAKEAVPKHVTIFLCGEVVPPWSSLGGAVCGLLWWVASVVRAPSPTFFLPLQVTFPTIETNSVFSTLLIAGNILEYPFHFTGSPVQVQKLSQGSPRPRNWSRNASKPSLELPNAEQVTASQVKRMFFVVIRQLLKTEAIFLEPKSTSEV